MGTILAFPFSPSVQLSKTRLSSPGSAQIWFMQSKVFLAFYADSQCRSLRLAESPLQLHKHTPLGLRLSTNNCKQVRLAEGIQNVRVETRLWIPRSWADFFVIH